MDTLEILLKIVTPIGVAIFIYLKKKEIRRILSNFKFSSSKEKYEADPDLVAEKLDMILRRYDE